MINRERSAVLVKGWPWNCILFLISGEYAQNGIAGEYMKVRIAVAFGSLVMGALGAISALAGPITLTNNGPSITLSYLTSNINVHGTATFSLSSGNTLTIVMTNTSTTLPGEGVITAIGWNTTPNTVINVSSSIIPTPWSYGTSGGGLGGSEHRDYVSGIRNGLDPIGSLTIAMRLAVGGLSELVLDDTAMHIQAIPGSPTGSEKPHGEPVPEPSTLVLLGVGLGVAAFARCRKNS